MRTSGLFIRATHYRASTRTGYVLICVAIAATGPLARGNWTQFRYDVAHDGVNPNETILSPNNVGELTVKWRVAAGAGGAASASVMEDRVYVIRDAVKSPRGNLYALDRNTGQQLWSFPPDAIVSDFSSTTPAVANGIVYFGVNRSGVGPVVYAVNAATGQEVWHHTGPLANVVSSPALESGRIYVAFTDGSIRALDATNGQIIWMSFIQAERILRQPLLTGDYISRSTTAVCSRSTPIRLRSLASSNAWPAMVFARCAKRTGFRRIPR